MESDSVVNVEMRQVALSASLPTTTTTTMDREILQTTQQQPQPSSGNSNNNSNGNNNNKFKNNTNEKSSSSSSSATVKFHQFRAPQQFIHHKKCTTTVTTKKKIWNKRQNKSHNLKYGGGGAQQLQQQQQQQQNIIGGGGNNHQKQKAQMLNSASISLPASKADLENIQNIKNQIGHHSHQQQHHHHHHHQQQQQHHQNYHHHNHRLVGSNNHLNSSSAIVGGNICCCGVPLEKNPHTKQIYKKMLSHRNHHLLTTSGGSGVSIGGGSIGGGGSVGSAAAGNCINGGGGGGNSGSGSVGVGGTGTNIIGSGCINSCCCSCGSVGVGCGSGSATGKDVNTHNGIINGGGGTSNSSSICGSSGNGNICNHTAALYCGGGRSKFFLPDKRPRTEVIIPPTKFLLGGNISDPLNLNSLQNEALSNSNSNTPSTTPRRSPITTPPKVEVIIPPNIHDPLHLLDPVDSMEYEKQLTSPMKRKYRATKSKHRHRKKKPKRRRFDSMTSSSGQDSIISLNRLVTPSFQQSMSTSEFSTISLPTELTSSTTDKEINNKVRETTSVVAIDESSLLLAQNNQNTRSESPIAGRADSENVAASLGSADQHKNAKEYVAPTTISPPPSINIVGNEIEVVSMMANSSGQSPLKQKEKLFTSSSGGNDATTTTTTTTTTCHSRKTLDRDRVAKDLRLDLSGTQNLQISMERSNSIGSSGRKRKISEGNTSQKNKQFRRLDSMDKIVSPVVPQPGAWKRPPRTVPSGGRKNSRHRSTSASENELLSPIDELIKAPFECGDVLETSKLSVKQAEVSNFVLPSENQVKLETGTITDTMATATADNKKSGDSVELPTTIVVAPHKMPNFRPDGIRYQYGNYDRYTGFRHLNEFSDVRLQVFQRHVELFQNKDILDIGCNAGHMTITLARNLAPKSILGIDIDKNLIARARRNLSLFVRIPPEDIAAGASVRSAAANNNSSTIASKVVEQKRRTRKLKSVRRHQQQQQQQQQVHRHPPNHHPQLHVDASELFPISFPLTYGGIPSISMANDASFPAPQTGNNNNSTPPMNNTNSMATTTTTATTTTSTTAATTGNVAVVVSSGGESKKFKNEFPKNVFFRVANYVLKDEAQLNNDTQQYDLILCLSVTKWIHLNFGDNGLKMAFKRMFNQLRPGGKLILEAQNWASYKKKKNLTETIYKNYRSIEFFPNNFHEYLLSTEVGFSHSYSLGVPRHLSKGFCRPIQLYAKGDYTPNHVRWSDAYYPQTPYEAYRGIYATIPTRPPYLMSGGNYDTPHGGNSGSYSMRHTPMHQPTSQYYNPLETDSYLPSYDMEAFNQMYIFASPLYQTIWSPPASLRNSSSHTPLFGSVREMEYDDGFSSYRRHVYPPNDEISSPNANAGGAFSSIRDTDTDDSSQPTTCVRHVYANGESSSSPQVNYSETLEGIINDESSHHLDTHSSSGGSSGGGVSGIINTATGCDSNDS